MKQFKHLLAALVVLSIGVSALASPNLAGKWKGKLFISMPKLPPKLTPEQKQQVDKAMAQVKKATILLTLKNDKSYTATTQGIPSQNETDTGTWTQSGNTVMITSTRKNPKNGKVTPTQKLKLSADGKTLTLNIPPAGSNNKAVFSRV